MKRTVRSKPRRTAAYASRHPLRYEVLDNDRHWLAGSSREDTVVCTTRAAIEKVIERVRSDSIWISRTASRTEDLAKALIARLDRPSRRTKFGRLLALETTNTCLLPTLQGLFTNVVGGAEDFQSLPPRQLATALRSDAAERRNVFLGGSLNIPLGAAVLVRGDFEQLLVPLTLFRPSGKSAPDFTCFAVTDFGHTLKFGDYEATSDSVLWTTDPEYRARAKANERFHAKGFGPALRRLRKQRGLLQSDFPNVARKTISRIEKGEVEKPHGHTLARIAQTLGVAPEDIETY